MENKNRVECYDKEGKLVAIFLMPDRVFYQFLDLMYANGEKESNPKPETDEYDRGDKCSGKG